MNLDEAIIHAREVAEGKHPNIDGCSECAEQHGQLAGWLEELKAYKATLQTPEEVEKLKMYMQPFTIRDMDRFREIMQAEKEGRLAVLPCKVGDTVFAAETSPVIPLSVMCVCLYLEGTDGGDWESLQNFGETVFLTREEAEAALKGGR